MGHKERGKMKDKFIGHRKTHDYEGTENLTHIISMLEGCMITSVIDEQHKIQIWYKDPSDTKNQLILVADIKQLKVGDLTYFLDSDRGFPLTQDDLDGKTMMMKYISNKEIYAESIVIARNKND